MTQRSGGIQRCRDTFVQYDIKVKTGDCLAAGTDANVFICLYGCEGNTGYIILGPQDGDRSDIFEQGNKDKFTIEGVDVGDIKSIRIGHDNKGSFAGWYLDTVSVKARTCYYEFVADQWLEKKKLEIDLAPTMVAPIDVGPEPKPESGPFVVTSIDCLVNAKDHHTDDYENENIVIRRGSSFILTIFYGGFDAIENMIIQLKTGTNPKKRNGTLIDIAHNKNPAKDEWAYRFLPIQAGRQSQLSAKIKVSVPVNALVSSYQLQIYAAYSYNGRKEIMEYPMDKPLYILFNPWNKYDEVYMEDESLKEEYVLNESGWVFWGGHKPKPWTFAQFSDEALKCTFKLLEIVGPVKRDTVIEVVRHMSAMANSCDNNGLIAGNWSGKYDGGKKPWEWAGSRGIFKTYLETGKSVNFGQCWVFSAVLTSMMRCLGIPCRSVTNYDSAHDTDNNCTNDKYVDEDLNYLDDESDDSVWNFHVWNDVWMARADLPPGMGGWQAVDGTPQERSQGIFQCGPVSLQAIKEGNIELPFDGRFLFAEVNADTVYWQKTASGETKAIKVKKNSIGTAILTKKPNVDEVEDITSQYKYEEGSMFERAIVRNVMRKVKNPVVEAQPKGVTFACKVPWNISGEGDCTLKVTAKNKKHTTHTVTCAVVAQVVRYTGVKVQTLEKIKLEEKIGCRDEHTFQFTYPRSTYAQFLDENVSIRFSVMAKVAETNQVFVTQKMSNLQKPELLLETGDEIYQAGDVLVMKIHIPKTEEIKRFTGCSLSVDSTMIADSLKVELSDAEVNSSKGYVEKEFDIKKKLRKSAHVVNVTFNSKEISGVHGSITVPLLMPR